jgi:hypothetical protein
MTKLEEIFQIGEKAERLKALIEYARAVKINPQKARNAKGEVSENELAVLLFDAEQSRKTVKLQNIGLVAGALFVAAVVGFFVMILMKALQGGGMNIPAENSSEAQDGQ